MIFFAYANSFSNYRSFASAKFRDWSSEKNEDFFRWVSFWKKISWGAHPLKMTNNNWWLVKRPFLSIVYYIWLLCLILTILHSGQNSIKRLFGQFWPLCIWAKKVSIWKWNGLNDETLFIWHVTYVKNNEGAKRDETTTAHQRQHRAKNSPSR